MSKKNNKVVNNIGATADTKNAIRIISVVLIIFLVVYLLTVYITTNSTEDIEKKKIENTTVQYDEILASTSLSQKDNEYMVLFYNTKEDDNSTYYTLKSDYEAKEDAISFYYVDLGSKLNSFCTSSEDNPYAETIDELKISQPTLIKVEDNKIVDYLIGESQIKNYLN